MNTITLNGVSSATITGLLIQELPPVSKPLIRTQIETIDGRDGDIITSLGYSAYDRTARIGLRYNFDIDDVIKFFNSEGTAIFSNEPDKVYQYKVLDQIDFNRLIRFREADVVFHVQPYKLEAYETEIDTTSTSSISVTNKGNVPARPIITVYGSGNINISLNGNQIFTIAMGDAEYITIDTDGMNAYAGGLLMNRRVTGDYSQFFLPIGTNTISVTGTDVDNVIISNYSRWV